MIILGFALLSVTPVSAERTIVVDGHKSDGEWNESWAFGQVNATTYPLAGPFGDRFVIRQGGFAYPTANWSDQDPKNDSGTNFDTSMAALGESSGFDISRIYAYYDSANDVLYGLCEVYGIPGDLDGDGDISENVSEYGDTLGDVGPAGEGLGDFELWEIQATQDDTSILIGIRNNNWTVTTVGTSILYDDVVAKFNSTNNPCYEISINNLSQHFVLEPGTSIKIEIRAGGLKDGPGEDMATVFVNIPLIPPKAMIGDYVWNDTNKDGIQNSSESGIPEVTVDLMQGSTIVSTTTTNASGIYLFNDLAAGCYDVVINSSNFDSGNALEYYTASPANAGTDDTIDSDGINNASSVCVAAGDVNLTIDFGYNLPTAMIGDYVWNDTNKDGIQNGTESGISGVTVDLMQGSSIVSTTTTNASGIYLFNNLAAGCYDVVINSSNFDSGNALQYYAASPANAGTDDTIDSDGINNASSVCVDPGDVNLTIDFGYHKPVVYNTKTIGYWKNHPDDWPMEFVTIGVVNYTKAEAITILNNATSEDATKMLAAQLIAAKLNVAAFGEAAFEFEGVAFDISDIINESDEFLADYEIGGGSLDPPTGGDRDQALYLKDLLDGYNNMWDT